MACGAAMTPKERAKLRRKWMEDVRTPAATRA